MYWVYWLIVGIIGYFFSMILYLLIWIYLRRVFGYKVSKTMALIFGTLYSFVGVYILLRVYEWEIEKDRECPFCEAKFNLRVK